MADDDDQAYANIRSPELLGPVLHTRLIEITQHDQDEFHASKESRIYLHFDNGYTVSFPIADAGFDIEPPE